jgi:hypothetical protein
MTVPIVALIAEWPERWRYPRLAVAVGQDGPAPAVADLAGLLLADLAQPRTLGEALAALIADGEFASAEQLVLELLEAPDIAGGAGLTDEDLRQAEDNIAAGQEEAEAEALREWAALDARAEAVGMAGEPAVGLAALARERRPAACDSVGRRAARIATVENEVRSDLKRQVADWAVVHGDADGYPEWSEAVQTLIQAGEFAIARAVIVAGPDRVPSAGPLTVPQPPVSWPWPDRPVAEVLTWYAEGGRFPDVEFLRFRPPAEDELAARLLIVVRAMAEWVTVDAVRAFAAALTELVGDPAAPRAEEMLDGFVTRVFGLRDSRLPQLASIADGVAVWVSASTSSDTAPQPPPAGIGPVVWFRPILVAPGPPRADVAMLDIADLLRLMAPGPSRRASTAAERRINLLRLLVPRFGAAVALGDGPILLGEGASWRDSLAWLFDLLGLLPDAPVLEVLRRDSSEHPAALRSLLDGLLESVERRGGGRRVTTDDLRSEHTPLARERIRSAVLAPLAANASARLVLWLVLWQFDQARAFTVDEVLGGYRYLEMPDRVAARVATPDAVVDALDTLASARLVWRDADRYRLPAAGLGEALLEPTGGGPRERAVALIREIDAEMQSADDVAAAALGPRITHLIGHRVDNDVIMLTGKLSRAADQAADPALRAELDGIRKRVTELGGGTYVALYRSLLTPPELVDVASLIGRLIGDVEWYLPDKAHIRRTGEARLGVRANPVVIREALRILVLNAAQALGGPRRTGQPPAIQVSARDVPEPPPDVPLTGPAIAVEVTDSGPGFTPEELRQYRALTDPAAPPWTPGTSAEGRGRGLPMATAWLREYNGILTIANSADGLGGGCVSMWLPAAAPTSA